MSVRDLIDSTREAFVVSTDAPTRAIVYKRSSDDTEIPLNSFVSGNDFNQDMSDDKKVNTITCRGLVLEQEPTKTDTILYNGKTYTVREWDKSGSVYSVMAENSKRNKVTSRSFK